MRLNINNSSSIAVGMFNVYIFDYVILDYIKYKYNIYFTLICISKTSIYRTPWPWVKEKMHGKSGSMGTRSTVQIEVLLY